jgi:hypothetical protein
MVSGSRVRAEDGARRRTSRALTCSWRYWSRCSSSWSSKSWSSTWLRSCNPGSSRSKTWRPHRPSEYRQSRSSRSRTAADSRTGRSRRPSRTLLCRRSGSCLTPPSCRRALREIAPSCSGRRIFLRLRGRAAARSGVACNGERREGQYARRGRARRRRRLQLRAARVPAHRGRARPARRGVAADPARARLPLGADPSGHASIFSGSKRKPASWSSRASFARQAPAPSMTVYSTPWMSDGSSTPSS